MTKQEKLNLVTNYFSEDWAIEKAMSLLEDYEKAPAEQQAALKASPSDIAKLRHLYANLKNGGVRDTAQAKRIADGLLAPIIERMEQADHKAVPAPLSDDTKRLAWMADGWTPGHEKLYVQHVLETGGVGDLDDLRTFIDKQITAQGVRP